MKTALILATLIVIGTALTTTKAFSLADESNAINTGQYEDCLPKKPETANTVAQQKQLIAAAQALQSDESSKTLLSQYNSDVAQFDTCTLQPLPSN